METPRAVEEAQANLRGKLMNGYIPPSYLNAGFLIRRVNKIHGYEHKGVIKCEYSYNTKKARIS